MRSKAVFALSFAWLLLGLATTPSRGSAQTILTSTGAPSAYRFYRAPGQGSFIGIDSPDVDGELVPSADVLFDYAYRPFALDDYDCLTYTTDTCTGRELDVVEHAAVLQLTGALALFDRVQIGVNVPIVLTTAGDGHQWRDIVDGVEVPRQILGGNASGLGDPRLHLKVRLFEQDLGEGARLSVGVVGWMTFPLAHITLPARYMGDANISAGGHFNLGFRWRSLRASLQLGGGFHDEQELIRSRRTAELTWGAAIAYDFAEWVGAMVEIEGQTTFGLVFDNEAPTELRAAVVFHVGPLNFTLGAGFGIAYAIGVPVVRALGGVSYRPVPELDSDGDGISDSQDGCPAEREDVDGYADDDGCPDLDDDEDGIPDDLDRCPREAEDPDGHDDEDGCPDPDDDGDGIPDGYDSCPNEPEDMDGDRDDDGCPDADRDRDNIPDELDACPEEAEDTDGLGDEDGCPEEDFDEDGVLDVDDECPEEREDLDGFEDGDGCPEEGSGAARRERAR